MLQQSAVGRNEITLAVLLGQGVSKALPLLGKEFSDAATEQPVEFLLPAGRYAKQNQLRDVFGKLFRVGERQGAAP